ncbi:MAG: amidase [Betaproteobacteria bacterium]|nr:amidase [Betaproteobacteria bacterium]
MKRRTLLLASSSLLALKAPAMPRTAAALPELPEVSATTLAQAMAAGRTTAVALVQACSARITAIDRRGPKLNSVIEMNPDALAIARERDAERRAGQLRGPLHGLPVLLKDNIATADRMSTSAGSLALDGVHAARDAFLVQRLRDGGAVILGKTNLSEWANIRSSRSVSGWSARGGLTRNPYALDRSTSGSSSGTAAAVAASLSPLGVGTETDGSIVSPASINGLVGLKPTLGRISRSGVIPIAHSQDTAGPMTRTVADAALLYAAMLGTDAEDHITTTAPAPQTADGLLTPDALKGARLGVARAYFTGYDEADAVIEAAIARLRALGATVIDDAELPAVSYGDDEFKVLLYELKHDLPLWLRSYAPQAKVQTLADVIEFNRKNAVREMPWFRQELFEKAQALGGLDSPDYLAALAACAKGARTEGLDRAFDKHRLDAIIAPTGGPAWLIDPVGGDHYGASFSTPAAVAGYPHLTVPAGFVQGLPLGLSFVGRPFSEWRLLALGHAFEQATRHRRAPAFLKRSVPV